MSILRDIIARLHLLSDDEEEERKNAPRGVAKGASIDKSEVDDFTKKLDHILEHHDAGVSDHVYLVDLENLKEQLGGRWDKNNELLHSLIESILNRRMGASDLFISHGDSQYMLVFPTLSTKEGQIKARIISEEITKKVLGEGSQKESVTIKAASIDEKGKIEFKDAPPIDEIFDEILHNIEKGGAKGGREQNGSDTGNEKNYLDSVKYVFRPMLAVQSKLISTFMVLPIKAIPGGYDSGYNVIPSVQSHDWTLPLDKRTLTVTSEALDALYASKKHSLLAVPVHFETLADHQSRIEYLQLCTKLFTERENRIVFEIVGLPEGIPQARLLELVTELHPHARSVIGRFSVEHTSFPSFRVAGLHAVGIDIFDSEKSEDVLMQQMKKFVASAKKNQLKTYAIGVRSISMYTIAVTEGFDYMAGYALTQTASSAEEVYAFQLDMPYLALLESLSEDKG